MRKLTGTMWLIALVCHLGAEPVRPPAGVDHSAWDALLRRYVDNQGLIDYGAWHRTQADRLALDTYLAQFAAADRKAAVDAELKAALINAYNAFTVRTVLQAYPIESIHNTDHPFAAARHAIGGREVSLDEIEHDTLRPLGDYRVHAALVCAARSCPPLLARAWQVATLDADLDARFEAWLARADLNNFDARRKRAEVSTIFSWFEDDFKGAGGVASVLARHAPQSSRPWLATGQIKVKYLDYNWGLNDQGERGRSYGKWDRLRDKLRNAR